MEHLNSFAKSNVYLDLSSPNRILKPWSMFTSILHPFVLFMLAIRFGLFLFGWNSEDGKFYLGVLALDYICGARIWTLAFAMMASLTCGCYYICYRENQKDHGDFLTLLREPIRSSLPGDDSNLRRLCHFGTFSILCAATAVCFIDTIPVILITIDEEKGFCWYLYCLLSTYQLCIMATSVCSAVVTFGLFLRATCNVLKDRFQQTSLRLSKRLIKIKSLPITGLLIQFDEACAEVKKFDVFWKKIFFIIIYGYTIVLGCAFYVSSMTDLVLPIKILALIVTIQFFIIVSSMILFAGSVNALARSHHSLFSSLARSSEVPVLKKIKLLYAMKRFTKPISFTLWDSNSLEYEDYYQFVVGLVSNFILVANLLRRNTF